MAEGTTEISPQTQAKALETPAPPRRGFFSRFFPKTAVAQNTQEQEAKLPPLSIDILFSEHETSEDAKKIGEKFKTADIFAPEGLGYTPENLETIRKVSRGILSPEDAIKDLPVNYGDFFTEQLRQLYKTNIAVTSIDVPLDHFLIDEFKSLDEFRPDLSSNFENFLGGLRKFTEGEAKAQSLREDHMVSQLKPMVKKLLAVYPNLRGKEELRILLSLGSAHTGVRSGFVGNAQDVDWEFSQKPHVYDFSSEILRRNIFKKEISDDLMTKYFLEKMFKRGMNLGSLTDNGSKQRALIRKILNEFNYQDGEDVYNLYKQQKKLTDIFSNKLQDKGIVLPKNEQELDDFLAGKSASPVV